LKWVDKGKTLSWLSANASCVHSGGLSTKSVANVVQNFENPKYSAEKKYTGTGTEK
jgi:hypothetical protein